MQLSRRKLATLVALCAVLTLPLVAVYSAGGRIEGKVTDPKGAKEATIASLMTLQMPEMPTSVTPLVYAIPVQLLAYHTAVNLGTDIDQPRNLAKSVTVE